MNVVQVVVTYILWIFLLFLIGRLILELVQSFARSWRPTGFLLVLAEIVYTITDPPLKLLRRFIPPLRLGNVALDLSFTVLFFVVYITIVLVGG